MGTLLEAAPQQRSGNTFASGRAAALTPSLKPTHRGGSRGIREGTGSPSPRSGHAAGVASLCPAPPVLPAQPPGRRGGSGRPSPHGAGLPSPERRYPAQGSPAPRGTGGRRTLRGGRDGKGREGATRGLRGARALTARRGRRPAGLREGGGGTRRGGAGGAPGSPPLPPRQGRRRGRPHWPRRGSSSARRSGAARGGREGGGGGGGRRAALRC